MASQHESYETDSSKDDRQQQQKARNETSCLQRRSDSTEQQLNRSPSMPSRLPSSATSMQTQSGSAASRHQGGRRTRPRATTTYLSAKAPRPRTHRSRGSRCR
ncbi:hypothetical protein HPP92_008457 [Vanilla planifolia]|uniref:Uncharacterized protein n=1 Tax=Vanilla planifolia TaxID=51239 RepID=A0A835RHR6_VANPL|nr:hypothetical protein HPP92_008457 [Vanilla planifolia]